MMGVRLFLASTTSFLSVLATDLHVAAFEPTIAGQIGINPVTPITIVVTATDAIVINTQATGDPKVDIGSIGVNTQYLTAEGGTTKWIGSNTAYLTDLVQTVTINSAATTVTNTPSMQIVGPVDDDGFPTGDFDLLVTPLIVGQIQALADTFCKDKATCSADFPPRVEALLRNGGDILTKRGVEWAVIGGLAIIGGHPWVQEKIAQVYAWGTTKYFKMAFAGEPIPNVIHIEISQDAAPSPAIVKATNFVIEIEAMPTMNVEIDEDDPNEDDDENEACWIYVGVDVDPTGSEAIDEATDGEDDTASERRSIAGRVWVNGATSSRLSPGIVKRAEPKKYVNQIGNCDTAYGPVPNVIARAELFPAPQAAMAPFNLQAKGKKQNNALNGLDPNMYWYVPAQSLADFDQPCKIAQLTKKGKKNPADPSITKDNFPIPYDQSTPLRTLTVEHIFERSTLQDFFSTIFPNADDPRCKPFISIFDKPDAGMQAGLLPRFYTLWSQQSNPLPGNWAFAGVDKRINDFKGVLLNPNLESYPEPKNVGGYTGQASRNFDKLFQTWNNARDFEDIQKCEKDPSDTTPSIAWAEEFKKYMTNLLKNNQVLIQTKIADLNTRISAQGPRLQKSDDSGEPNEYGKALASLQSIYPVSHFVYNTAAMLKFLAQGLGIRDDTSTKACSAVSSSTTTSVVASSTSSTPSATCVIRTVVNCVYQYEDRPDLSTADCPPIPPLPASCGGSGPGVTSTSTPTPTPQPPVIGTQGCYAKENHEDILGAAVKDDSNRICSQIFNSGGGVTMDANTVSKMYNPTSWYLGVNNYWYGVGWVTGCQTTATTQLVLDPLGDSNQDHSCAKLLLNSWANCNNGGTGGWIDAGCLRYTFKASTNGLTDDWKGVVKTS